MGRAPTVTPVDPWPQTITKVAEPRENLSSLIAQDAKLIVEGGQLAKQLVALRLKLKSGPSIEGRCIPHGELAARANRF